MKTENIYHELLGTGGEVAGRIPGFIARDGQVKMASVISEIVSQSKNSLIEAGTGTGKTFAYLLPVMASHKKTIISTGTKNLQDQLYYQDIPLVNESFHRRVALLKGRSNYLCLHRMAKNIKTIDKHSNEILLAELVRVQNWSRQTRTGDLTELLDFDQTSPVISLVTSTADNCLGSACDRFDECLVYKARARALEADIIVVNHHLLFADIALREKSGARLLPAAEIVIIDEAHQVPDVARQFFGERISSRQLHDLARDIRQEIGLFENDDAVLLQLTQCLDGAVAEMAEICLASNQPLDLLLKETNLVMSLGNIDVALSKLMAHLHQVAERSIAFGHCYSRALQLSDLFAWLTKADIREDEYAHWIERHGISSGRAGFTIFLSPVNVADEIGPVFNESDKSWIFVSATMTIAGRFDHIRTSLGLDDVVESRFDSPFNFEKQVRAYVPPGLPSSGSELHTEKLLEHILPFVRACSGRTFFLFTSHRALDIAAERMKFEYDIVFLKQGAMPKKMLLEKFKQLPRCILLATMSFWEGVDVRGSDLRILIIDKLPFASPDSPMVQAQLRSIESLGGNGFTEFSLPEAAISLQQGFGRLIRQETDQGLFILGDARILNRSYGKMLLQSLPRMKWLNHPDEVLDYLEQLENDPTGECADRQRRLENE